MRQTSSRSSSSKSSHTPKEKRMAAHIKASEKSSGKSPKRSEEIAWATVNKKRKTAKAGSKTKKH